MYWKIIWNLLYVCLHICKEIALQNALSYSFLLVSSARFSEFEGENSLLAGAFQRKFPNKKKIFYLPPAMMLLAVVNILNKLPAQHESKDKVRLNN